MSPVVYTYTESDRSASLFIQAGDVMRTIASTNPRFARAKEYLLNTPEEDVTLEEVLRLVDAGSNVINGIVKLSERVSLEGGTLYFDGDALDNALSNHIVRMIHGDDDNYMAFVNFMENLAQNPERRSRLALFKWLDSQKLLTITEDGLLLAYKGVQDHPDNLSISQGVEKVLVNGAEHVGHIPNPIGATVEMPRSLVDDNGNQGCSVGLHAGTYGYASNFGSKLLLVAINPRDVVSVPKDSNAAKMRVCRYVVVDNAEGQLEDPTYKGRHSWNPDLVSEAPEASEGLDNDTVDAHDADEEIYCIECGCYLLSDDEDEVCKGCEDAEVNYNSDYDDTEGEPWYFNR